MEVKLGGELEKTLGDGWGLGSSTLSALIHCSSQYRLHHGLHPSPTLAFCLTHRLSQEGLFISLTISRIVVLSSGVFPASYSG